MTARFPVFLDTDLGIDDALALQLLLASPEAEVVGIGSVHGNVDAPTAAQNVLDLLALAAPDLDVPVAVGAADPLAHGYAGGSPHVHGANGIGGVTLVRSGRTPDARSAAQLLVDLARAHPGLLRVVAVGPLTNLALALRLDPDLPGLVAGVYVMGGAALAPGNVTPVAEANIWHDPEAAAAVFDAPWPITLAPLDVTMDHRLTAAQVDRIGRDGGPAGAAVAAMVAFYADFYAPIYGRPDVALHDPLAVALALELVTPVAAPVVPVTVDTTHGPGRGQTICDLRGRFVGHPLRAGAHTRVVLSVAQDVGELLVERVTR